MELRKWVTKIIECVGLRQPTLAILVGLMTLAIGLSKQLLSSRPLAAAQADPDADMIDTIIPKGFVLLPIEIQNLEAVDSVVGQRSLVDLFSKQASGRSRLLLPRVVLLRAPFNPRQFAVLIRQDDTSRLIDSANAIFVALANPSDFRSEIPGPSLASSHAEVPDKKKVTRPQGVRIVYEDQTMRFAITEP